MSGHDPDAGLGRLLAAVTRGDHDQGREQLRTARSPRATSRVRVRRIPLPVPRVVRLAHPDDLRGL